MVKVRIPPKPEPTKRPIDVDERDWMEMLMTEPNEEEAAEILEEPSSGWFSKDWVEDEQMDGEI